MQIFGTPISRWPWWLFFPVGGVKVAHVFTPSRLLDPRKLDHPNLFVAIAEGMRLDGIQLQKDEWTSAWRPKDWSDGGRALGGLLVGMLNDHDSSAVNWSPYKISAGVWYVWVESYSCVIECWKALGNEEPSSWLSKAFDSTSGNNCTVLKCLKWNKEVLVRFLLCISVSVWKCHFSWRLPWEIALCSLSAGYVPASV